ncbi:MAG: hypothetical protein BWY89_01287 [Bacteroidetes bacterium ADurb.BinA012]|nr:MAG: hypothetical protein BWY89_01287 [Bacteroidetes bacterium ADurb.BinA012]
MKSGCVTMIMPAGIMACRFWAGTRTLLKGCFTCAMLKAMNLLRLSVAAIKSVFPEEGVVSIARGA